jgi:hypothetical protein
MSWYDMKTIGDDLLSDLKKDNVNNPSHYNKGKIEAIDFILDQNMDFLEGNCLKYLIRYKHKNGLEDLLKSKWYLEKLIERHAEKT